MEDFPAFCKKHSQSFLHPAGIVKYYLTSRFAGKYNTFFDYN